MDRASGGAKRSASGAIGPEVDAQSMVPARGRSIQHGCAVCKRHLGGCWAYLSPEGGSGGFFRCQAEREK